MSACCASTTPGVPRALYARGEILLLGGEYEVKSPAQWLTQTFAAWAAARDPQTGVDLRAAVVGRLATQRARPRPRRDDPGDAGGLADPRGVRVHYASPTAPTCS